MIFSGVAVPRWYDALDGVVAAPDHAGGLGKAGVYAPSLSREDIIEALRARHSYCTTGARILLEFRVEGALMGEALPLPGGRPVPILVRVRGAGPLAKIEILRNNRLLFSASPKGREATLNFLDRHPLKEPSGYYVRVTQKDGELAWSSPVWLGRRSPTPMAP